MCLHFQANRRNTSFSAICAHSSPFDLSPKGICWKAKVNHVMQPVSKHFPNRSPTKKMQWYLGKVTQATGKWQFCTHHWWVFGSQPRVSPLGNKMGEFSTEKIGRLGREVFTRPRHRQAHWPITSGPTSIDSKGSGSHCDQAVVLSPCTLALSHHSHSSQCEPHILAPFSFSLSSTTRKLIKLNPIK